MKFHTFILRKIFCMKKTAAFILLTLFLNACGIISNLNTLSDCEYRFHSAEDPVVAGIDMSRVSSFSDLSFAQAATILSSILGGSLPLHMTANVEVKNPGATKANVNQLDWIAYIDDIEVARGIIEGHFEIAPNGGTTIIPVDVDADLYDYLTGDNPKTMLNFALNLADAGGEPVRIGLKIKPSLRIGKKSIKAPGYFKISTEYSSGN